MQNTEIRVAILCKGKEFEYWEAESIRQVMNLPFVKIVLLIEEIADEIPAPGFFGKLANYPYKNFLWRYHKRFRLRVPATAMTSLAEELKSVPVIHCKPELRGKYSQHITENDLQKIKTAQPDLILRFGFNILRGEILTLAKYGVWSFHHADESFLRGGPAAFWEIYKRNPATGALLQRLTEKLDAGIVIRKGWYRTINRSHRANLQQLLMGTTGWMKQALIDIANGIPVAENNNPVKSAAPIHYYPTNGEMLRAWWMTRMNKIRFHYKTLFLPEIWNVGMVRQSAESVLQNGIQEVEWLPEAPRGQFYADPFGWEKNGYHIVFEHYDYKTEKGYLSIYEDGRIRELLRYKHHLSYPFIFPEADSYRIVPECFESGNLLSFQSEKLNEPEILIKDFAAVDPSFIEWNGRWWMFCTKGGDFSNVELYIFHSDQPFGKWIPHANNPVKNDIRSARPGGTPFVRNGKLYRPGQDCSTTYGAAVVLHEVTELSATRFAEEPVRRLEPKANWNYPLALHTFSIVDEKLLLIDAKRLGFNFDNFAGALKRKLKRVFGK